MANNRWNRTNKYEEFENGTRCTVYNYNLNTIKEMEADGWKCTGTYVSFFTFWKEK